MTAPQNAARGAQKAQSAGVRLLGHRPQWRKPGADGSVSGRCERCGLELTITDAGHVFGQRGPCAGKTP